VVRFFDLSTTLAEERVNVLKRLLLKCFGLSKDTVPYLNLKVLIKTSATKNSFHKNQKFSVIIFDSGRKRHHFVQLLLRGGATLLLT